MLSLSEVVDELVSLKNTCVNLQQISIRASRPTRAQPMFLSGVRFLQMSPEKMNASMSLSRALGEACRPTAGSVSQLYVGPKPMTLLKHHVRPAFVPFSPSAELKRRLLYR